MPTKIHKNSNPVNRCLIDVRKIPLESFRLPRDGRKWKQAARSRSEFLLRLAGYANGDGSFVRDGVNYSPSTATLLKHMGNGSIYRLSDDLRELDLLSWTRERHYDRRIYQIHLENHLPDSEISPPTLEQDALNHLPHSQKSPPTTVTIRLYPSNTKNQSPLTPLGGMLDVENLEVQNEITEAEITNKHGEPIVQFGFDLIVVDLDEPEPPYIDNPSAEGIRRLRERRRHQVSTGLMSESMRDMWEQLSRSDFPEQWNELDLEDADVKAQG